MSFDYDSLQAGQIIWLYIIHGYVRTDASNIHTVALSTCKNTPLISYKIAKSKDCCLQNDSSLIKLVDYSYFLFKSSNKYYNPISKPHYKPRGWLQKECTFKKPFFCMSNVCLLPCDALFLRCIGVDGAIFVGRSPVPSKSKRGQLQTK